MLSLRYSMGLCAIALSCTLAAHADVVNFDAQAAGASNVFTGTVNSPLAIGDATFSGGQLLINEVGSVDLTGVYATTNLVSGAYTNPLQITFATPVSGFSILVTNNIQDTFTAADNLGDSSSAFLALNSEQTFSLSGSGITSVTISAANNSSWDFAIDNVTFTPTAAATPEPSSLVLLGTGLAALARFGRRRRVA